MCRIAKQEVQWCLKQEREFFKCNGSHAHHYLWVLHQSLQTEGFHFFCRNRRQALSIRQPISTKAPQTALQHQPGRILATRFEMSYSLATVCDLGADLCTRLPPLPFVQPWTACSPWAPARWSTERICRPQREEETPAADVIHPLRTNPEMIQNRLRFPASEQRPREMKLQQSCTLQMVRLLKTYIFQVGQWRWGSEKSQVHLRSSGQAYCGPLVDNLRCCLVLVVWIIHKRFNLKAAQFVWSLVKKESSLWGLLPRQWWLSASSWTACSLVSWLADCVLFSRTHNATSCGCASTRLKCSEKHSSI